MNARSIAMVGCLVLAGCIASNPVAPDDRMVTAAVDKLQFAPAGQLALSGLYQSIDVRGDIALGLRRIWYWFRADGTYTAAALVEADAVAFQTRDGTWQLTAAGLVLDGDAPVAVEVAGDHVRLTSASGSFVLHKELLQ
ncbi:MAG: hypothetical protein JNK15_16580 [Planctomycetes bacterium]|nr:hypothetical protein [Planctomycetota bacterium]